ncbi:hypothetical protein [Providencia rettgeri]|uniref:hypothetical protein n=1 Tax=Providencia rettgeri TaxID=587 RepID=UPI0030168D99
MIKLTLAGKTLIVTEDELVKHIDECKLALSEHRTGHHAAINLTCTSTSQSHNDNGQSQQLCEF